MTPARRGRDKPGPHRSAAIPLTPNPPINIVPTNIARLKLSGKSPMNLGIPPLQIKIVLESNTLKSTMLVGRSGVINHHEKTWATCDNLGQKGGYMRSKYDNTWQHVRT